MWAELKTSHFNATRARVELAIAAVALALIAVLLTTFTTLATGQVRKAELRQALVQSERQAIVRCADESASAFLMRSCMAEVRMQTAQALSESYGLATRAPAPAVAANQAAPSTLAAGVSLASLR